MQLHENEIFTIGENTYKITDGKPELQSKEEIKMDAKTKFVDAKTRFMKIWCRMHPAYFPEKDPNLIFYFDIAEDCYFQLAKNGDLWCSYEGVWKIFEDEYHLKYKEIQTLMKRVLEEHFKMRGITPF